jgi:putative heme-binding domain-containing protein
MMLQSNSIAQGFGRVFLALFGLVMQLSGQQHGYSSSAVESGARLYAAHCLACHGPDGNMIAGVDFRSGKFRRGASDDDLMRIVRGGIPGTAMPPNSFTDSDLEAIVAYLRSMREFHSRTVVLGDPHRGQIVFELSGACLTCHRVNGKGSYLAIDLDDVGAIRSADYIERSLLDPNVSNLPEHRFVRAITYKGATIIGRRLNEDTFTVQLIEESGHLVSLIKPELREYILLNAPRMPSYKDKLSSRELEDVVAYLISLKGSGAQ